MKCGLETFPTSAIFGISAAASIISIENQEKASWNLDAMSEFSWDSRKNPRDIVYGCQMRRQ